MDVAAKSFFIYSFLRSFCLFFFLFTTWFVINQFGSWQQNSKKKEKKLGAAANSVTSIVQKPYSVETPNTKKKFSIMKNISFVLKPNTMFNSYDDVLKNL